MRIGFIGIGVMGRSMALNLMKDGHDLSIYTRTKSKAEELINKGSLWCDTIAQCVGDRDVVITIVGYPKDVEEVYFSEDGIIESASKGTLLIDMTTTSPELSKRIYSEGKKRGLKVLDAPVSGGDTGAKNGTLSIMVGGEASVFEEAKPIFDCLGKEAVLQGAAGAGQHTKMANQIAIAGAMAGVCEALTYGKAAGLDLEKMLGSIEKGAAGSFQMSNLAPRILAGDLEPGFYIKHFIKDMKIADNEGKQGGLHLGILESVLKMYESLMLSGNGDLGTQGLIKYYDEADPHIDEL